jgi:deoxyribonuclease-4
MPETPPTSILIYDDTDAYRPEPPQPPAPPAWQDGSIRIGIHTSIAGDIVSALEIARRLGANALQIFSTSPRMWPRGGRARIAVADASRFRARRNALGLGPLVVHANYLINLASPERVLRARSIQAFHDEIVRCLDLGADYLVVHPGAARDRDARRGIQDVAEALRQAARGLKLGNLRILLENTAGQGASLGARLEELAALLNACPELPLGACIDTAHLLAVGYDIRTPEGLELTLQLLERTVGFERVFVVHVNDSKVPRGARVDRHQHIGKGHIGLAAFERILNHPLLAPLMPADGAAGMIGRAFILETPIDRPGDDLRNVRMLWSLVGGMPASVAAVAGAKIKLPWEKRKGRKKRKQRKQRRQRRRTARPRARTKRRKTSK